MTDFCVSNEIICREDIDVYVYGFEILLSYILNIVTVLLLAWVFDAFLYICIFLLFFYPLRIFSGGFHAEDYRKCYIISVVAIFLILLAENYVIMFWSSTIVVSLTIFFAIYIFITAPLEDINKPLDSAEIVKYRKKARIIVGIEFVAILSMIFLDRTHHITYYAACAMFTMFLLMRVGIKKKQ